MATRLGVPLALPVLVPLLCALRSTGRASGTRVFAVTRSGEGRGFRRVVDSSGDECGERGMFRDVMNARRFIQRKIRHHAESCQASDGRSRVGMRHVGLAAGTRSHAGVGVRSCWGGWFCLELEFARCFGCFFKLVRRAAALRPFAMRRALAVVMARLLDRRRSKRRGGVPCRSRKHDQRDEQGSCGNR